MDHCDAHVALKDLRQRVLWRWSKAAVAPAGSATHCSMLDQQRLFTGCSASVRPAAWRGQPHGWRLSLPPDGTNRLWLLERIEAEPDLTLEEPTGRV